MHPILLLLLGMVTVVGGVLIFRLHAFLALLLGALLVGALTPSAAIEEHFRGKGLSATEARELASTPVGTRIARGFGDTCGRIGILIALAAIIGRALLESGAAERIVRAALGVLGSARAGIAFLGSSFLLGIPVFFDTVFYLMVPLARATAARAPKGYLLFVLSITAGATMAHSLVPPTPGPLFVASELGVDIGAMIVGGSIVGAITAFAGYLFARWVSARAEIPLRDGGGFTRAELEELSLRPIAELPPLAFALAPILIPVALIALRTVLESSAPVDPEAAATGASFSVAALLATLGEKNVALGIAAVVALALVVWKPGKRSVLSSVTEALEGGGMIILITSAGGAFGSVLQQTGIGAEIASLATSSPVGVLPLAFAVTTLIRTAQGSATVAMITATGIVGGADVLASLDVHPVYLALAIGCGSKPFAWMNDSGFWVICKMSGLEEAEGLRSVTPLTALMGFLGLAVVLLASTAFPLV